MKCWRDSTAGRIRSMKIGRSMSGGSIKITVAIMKIRKIDIT